MLAGFQRFLCGKKAKEYGTCKLAEGGELENKRLVIIEDVVTSGGQVLLSAAELRNRGAIVEDVLCVIDRQPEETDTFAKEGLRLHALFKMDELKDAGEKMSRTKPQRIQKNEHIRKRK